MTTDEYLRDADNHRAHARQHERSAAADVGDLRGRSRAKAVLTPAPSAGAAP